MRPQVVRQRGPDGDRLTNAHPAQGPYDTSGLSPDARVIAVALQRCRMILAHNGSPWYVSGMSAPVSTATSGTSSISSPGGTWRSWTRAGWSTGRHRLGLRGVHRPAGRAIIRA